MLRCSGVRGFDFFRIIGDAAHLSKARTRWPYFRARLRTLLFLTADLRRADLVSCPYRITTDEPPSDLLWTSFIDITSSVEQSTALGSTFDKRPLDEQSSRLEHYVARRLIRGASTSFWKITSIVCFETADSARTVRAPPCTACNFRKTDLLVVKTLSRPFSSSVYTALVLLRR